MLIHDCLFVCCLFVCCACDRLKLSHSPRVKALPVGLGLLTDLRALWLTGCPSLHIPEHLKCNMGEAPEDWLQPITGEREDVAEAMEYAEELEFIPRCRFERVPVRLVGQGRLSMLVSWWI